MPRLGQHFLKSSSVAGKIVAALSPCAEETIIEIGPGHGELTEKIKNRTPKINIFTIEKDPTLVAQLEIRFRDNPEIHIIEGDVRTALSPLVASLSNQPYKIVGNIPYYLTGKLIRILGELPRLPVQIVLMMQKEVAERMTANPPQMNRLAAILQYWASPNIIGSVPRSEFSPPPTVDSAIIVLNPHTQPEISREIYIKMVKTLFAQPRKTILNNLSAAPSLLRGKTKLEITAVLKKIGAHPDARPQALTVEQITDLTELFA